NHDRPRCRSRGQPGPARLVHHGPPLRSRAARTNEPAGPLRARNGGGGAPVRRKARLRARLISRSQTPASHPERSRPTREANRPAESKDPYLLHMTVGTRRTPQVSNPSDTRVPFLIHEEKFDGIL